jgi:hypothetical protein
MGETHMRLAFERELMYAAEYPFIDYGADLELMARLDKGVTIKAIKRSEVDANPPKPLKLKIDSFLSKSKSRRQDFVPENFVGKGGKGYVLKNWVIHRGKGSAKVSRTFRDAVRLTGTD